MAESGGCAEVTTTCTIILGDCLDVMPALTELCSDLSFCDLPYGGTARNAWDTCLPLEQFLPALYGCSRSNSLFVFTADALLASGIIAALGNLFRYDMVWDKRRVTGFLNSKKAPLRRHEWILVAGNPGGNYIPIYTKVKDCGGWGNAMRPDTATSNYRNASRPQNYLYTSQRYPTSIKSVALPIKERGKHPTQKPVALVCWLIRTYSNAGDMILDPTSGSGTTAVAAATCGRNVTCIEKDEGYFEASVERVRKHIRDNLLDVKIEARK